MTANQARNVSEKGNPKEKADFIKKIGSNLVLMNQNIKYFPCGAWKILVNLGNSDAEPRSGEAKISVNFLKLPTKLAWQDGFRTYDWEKAFPSPEATISQVKQLLSLI